VLTLKLSTGSTALSDLDLVIGALFFNGTLALASFSSR
jgi:hypothetical protein